EEYGLDMLKAGADLSQKSAEELISLDAKEFTMGSQKVEIDQVNTVDTNEVLERRNEIENAMTNTINEKGLGLFVFAITDILTNDSTVIALGDHSDKVEKAFNS
ncbi:manganese-dependent inorganic pyrophosphatase, partial [Filobacillus milosensis]